MNKPMKTLKFKTNINSGGCIDRVSSYLNNAQDILHWSIDVAQNNDGIKVLTVIGDDRLHQKDVVDIVNLAGFHAKPLKKTIFSKILGE